MRAGPDGADRSMRESGDGSMSDYYTQVGITPGLHEGPRWRHGIKNPHTLYLQIGSEPNRRPWPAGDPFIGSVMDPEYAKRAVEAVNLVRAGLCGEVESLRAQLEMAQQSIEHLQAQLAVATDGQQGSAPYREEWVVWWGGPDPDNFAGREAYDDPDEAEGMQLWIPGSGVAKRTWYAGPWEIITPTELEE